MPMITPMKAIRKKCLDCSGGSAREVSLCPITTCPIYSYRYGKRPETVIKHQERQKEQV
jgi:hypothetical protein